MSLEPQVPKKIDLSIFEEKFRPRRPKLYER